MVAGCVRGDTLATYWRQRGAERPRGPRPRPRGGRLASMSAAAPPPPRALVLRPMTERDVPAVAAIDGRAFGAGAWPQRAFLAELRENRFARYFVLGERDGPPLGYAGCWLMPDGLHIVTLGVEPAQQRRGLGAALVMHAVDLALEARAPAVRLECRASNEAAQALYRGFGFEVVGRRRRYYSDDEDALVMVLAEVGAPPVRARLEARRARLGRERGIGLTRMGA